MSAVTRNPFKPTAGKNPPVLIGRDFVVDEFAEGIENGPGAPSRLMRITGMRGMGKTVMLNELAAYARGMGWLVVEETASEGFCERILATLTPEARIGKLTAAPSILGVSLGGVELDRAALSLREALQDAIGRNGHGLLITLDEVQDASIDEMRALAVAIQHEIRDDAEIAFVFAGLPSMIENVVNGKTLTFLRRAVPIELSPVGEVEVALALAETMRDSGLEVADSVADQLARATHGYPFMVQLVGYHTWQLAKRSGTSQVDGKLAEDGIRLARERFDATVIEPALQRVSPSGIAYLLAMAEDGSGPSESGTVASRLGKTTSQVASVRAHLLGEDVIEAPSWGKVSFAIPYMAEYLNMHREVLSSL